MNKKSWYEQAEHKALEDFKRQLEEFYEELDQIMLFGRKTRYGNKDTEEPQSSLLNNRD